MNSIYGGREPFCRLLETPVEAKRSQISLKTTISTSRTSRQYPHTIPGMVDAPQPSTWVLPEVLPRNPSCRWWLTTILPQTTVLLPSPCYCQWPQHQRSPAGAGVGPTGDCLIPESSLLEWTSHNSKGWTTLSEQ